MEEKTERDLLDIVRPPLFKRGMTDIQEQDFLQGVTDCDEGRPAKQDASESYNRGYATQYERDQINTEVSEAKNGNSNRH
jgi:hypothetical protein